MFNSLMIEGILIYGVVYGLLGNVLTRQVANNTGKVVLWIILFVMTFPGFFLWLVFWSGVGAAFSTNP